MSLTAEPTYSSLLNAYYETTHGNMLSDTKTFVAQNEQENLHPHDFKAEEHQQPVPYRLPRLVVRGQHGRKLDIYSSYQHKIYAAKERVRETGVARTPIEWRLPKGQVPCKPDYSMRGRCINVGKSMNTNCYKTQRDIKRGVNIKDVSFIAECLRYLALLKSGHTCPTFSGLDVLHLRDSLLKRVRDGDEGQQMGPELDAMLAGSMDAEMGRRLALLCGGCARNGFCSGCELSASSHYHNASLLSQRGHMHHEHDITKGNRPWHSDSGIGDAVDDVVSSNGIMENASQAQNKNASGINVRLSGDDAQHQQIDNVGRVRLGRPTRKMTVIEMQGVEDDLNGQAISKEDESFELPGVGIQVVVTIPEDNGDDKDNAIISEETIVVPHGAMHHAQSQTLTNGEHREKGEAIIENIMRNLKKMSTVKIVRDPERQIRTLKENAAVIPKNEDVLHQELKSEESSRETESRTRLYKEPKKFVLKKKRRRSTVARSPFNENRTYDHPKQREFTPSKSTHRVTQFLNVKVERQPWKEPKKFVLAHNERDDRKFVIPRRKTKSELKTLSRKGGLVSGSQLLDPQPTSQQADKVTEQDRTKQTQTQKPVTPLPPNDLVPPTVTPRPSPPVTPQQRVYTPPPLPLPKSFDVPKLPVFTKQDQQPKQRPVTTLLELPQGPLTNPSNEIPRATKRRGPPALRKRIKYHVMPASKKTAGVSDKKDVHYISNPIDFLSQYCIINTERLPLYERVFHSLVSTQRPRYPNQMVTSDDGDNDSYTSGSEHRKSDVSGQSQEEIASVTDASEEVELSPHELNLVRELSIINHNGTTYDNMGMTATEQYVKKLEFTHDLLMDKEVEIQKHRLRLEDDRMTILSKAASELFPEVVSGKTADSKQNKKKQKQKSAPSVVPKEIPDTMVVSAPPRPRAPPKTPPVDVMNKVTDKMMQTLESLPDICRIDLQISRTDEKLDDINSRIKHLQAQRKAFMTECAEQYAKLADVVEDGDEFKRKQSNPEMNIEDVEEALQKVNDDLLSAKEFQYLYHILNLPGRQRMGFHLFTIIAALSERVVKLDPLVRKLLNKINYEALDLKFNRCKELFALLRDGDYASDGWMTTRSLSVELMAGGLRHDTTAHVIGKFDRHGRGVVDFLDFVTYLPLFVEIHQRIIADPLQVSLHI